MEKYQNLTSNVGIILKKIRMMDKYIHGFQIRKIFPFHIILGAPDWQGYEKILVEAQQELKAQVHFTKEELKKSPPPSISSYLKHLQKTYPFIEDQIKSLIHSNRLHQDRFFDSSSVSLQELQQAITAYHDADTQYKSKAPKLRALYQDMLNSN